MNGAYNPLVLMGKAIAPDKNDPIPLPTQNGGGNGGNGGNGGLLAQYTTAPAFMPGSQGLLAHQLQAGFGTPKTNVGDFRQWLNNAYSPMTYRTNYEFGQRKFQDGKGDGKFEPSKDQMAMIAQYTQMMQGGDHGQGWQAQQLWNSMPKDLRQWYEQQQQQNGG